MAYIGKTPTIGNFQVCDAISVVNNQAAYTMKVDTVNVSPESANHMIVSLNGVIQKPTDAFTVSGSTITFASNLVTGDVINFIQILGNVLDLGVPSDNTVTTAKLSDSSVSLAKLTATGTKNSTTFLRGDNTFAEAGGGAMELLHTATGSNVTSININGYFTSDYDHYKLIYSVYGATGNTDTQARIMQGGSVITADNYWFAGMAWYYDGSTSQASTNVGFNTNKWGISSTDNTASSQYPTTGEMLFSNPLSTSQNTTMTTTSIGYNSGSPPNAIRVWNYAGTYISTTATSGISFHYDGGNINGTIRLYGIKNS
jgi:hypothetical protein